MKRRDAVKVIARKPDSSRQMPRRRSSPGHSLRWISMQVSAVVLVVLVMVSVVLSSAAPRCRWRDSSTVPPGVKKKNQRQKIACAEAREALDGGTMKTTQALVPVSYRIQEKNRKRILRISDATGIRVSRLVDQLLEAALDMREAAAAAAEPPKGAA